MIFRIASHLGPLPDGETHTISGQQFILLNGEDGCELFDADGHSLGFYSSKKDAMADARTIAVLRKWQTRDKAEETLDMSGSFSRPNLNDPEYIEIETGSLLPLLVKRKSLPETIVPTEEERVRARAKRDELLRQRPELQMHLPDHEKKRLRNIKP